MQDGHRALLKDDSMAPIKFRSFYLKDPTLRRKNLAHAGLEGQRNLKQQSPDPRR